MDSDKDFFWGRMKVLEECTSAIEYFAEQAAEHDSEDFTEEELVMLTVQARMVQKAGEEMVKRLTLPSLVVKKKVVVRRKKK